jgi:hypothetical protein
VKNSTNLASSVFFLVALGVTTLKYMNGLVLIDDHLAFYVCNVSETLATFVDSAAKFLLNGYSDLDKASVRYMGLLEVSNHSDGASRTSSMGLKILKACE